MVVPAHTRCVFEAKATIIGLFILASAKSDLAKLVFLIFLFSSKYGIVKQ